MSNPAQLSIIDCDSFSNVPSSPVSKRPKKRSKNRVKYWSLPTVSSGTFDPRFLTERQQLQYLAQKSKGVEDDALEVSPLRLDRIKLEEQRMMRGAEVHKSSPLVTGGVSKKLKIFTKENDGKVPINLSPNTAYTATKTGINSATKIDIKADTSTVNTITSTINTAITSTIKASFSSTSPKTSGTPVKSASTGNKQKKSVSLQSSPLSADSPSLNSRRAIAVKANFAKNSILLEEASIKEMLIGADNLIVNKVMAVDESIPIQVKPVNVQAFLEYHSSVRMKHLDAMMEAMKKRTGMSVEEAQIKRREILEKYQ